MANTLILIVKYKKRPQLNRLLDGALSLIGCLVAFLLLPRLASYGYAPLLGAALGALIFVPIFRLSFSDLRVVIARVTSVGLLGELGVPEAIPVLANEAVKSLMTMRPAQPAMTIGSAHALFQLLPALTYAHYRAFEKETIPNLCAILEAEAKKMTPNAMERVELLVEAFERIGDSRAILTVQSLKRHLVAKQREFEDRQLRAQTASWSRSVLETDALPQVTAVQNPYRSLQRKVESLLKTLEERRVQEELHDNLLRGSAAPDNASELLRPMTGKPEQEPFEQLLRGASLEDTQE